MQNDSKRFLFAGLGIAMIAGFFLSWTKGVHISGWDLVRLHGVPFGTRFALSMVPVLGAILTAGGLMGAKGARHAAVLSGVAVFGYTAYKIAWGMMTGMGLGLWLVFGAAFVGIIAGLASTRQPE